MSESVVKSITAYLEAGLRTALGMSATDIYAVVQHSPIKGMNPLVIQIEPQHAMRYGPGEGAWEGGTVQLKKRYFYFHIYKQLNTDQFAHSEDILAEANVGMIDLHQRLWDAMKNTNLGGLLFQTMEWDADAATNWLEKETGWVESHETWSVVYAESLGSFPSM